MSLAATAQLRFYDLKPQADDLRQDILDGLSRAQKRIPPKYFYDEQGSLLFEAICETEEYYPTRTEMRIIEDNLGDICACLGHDCVLIEPGSGSSQKVRLLLDRLEPHTYIPLDISSDYLKSVAHGLVKDYPKLNVAAACTDFTAPIDLPYCPEGRRRVAFFPGSSIGNFKPREAVVFLTNMADLVQPDGGLLIGVDLKKDPAILNAAYNDARGVTAAFNLNLLARLNHELGAAFNLGAFAHRAYYDEHKGRIEMHLVSLAEQAVPISGKIFRFRRGETIHTENSYKYTLEEFGALAGEAGFSLQKAWVDPDGLFSVQFYTLPGTRG